MGTQRIQGQDDEPRAKEREQVGKSKTQEEKGNSTDEGADVAPPQTEAGQRKSSRTQRQVEPEARRGARGEPSGSSH